MSLFLILCNCFSNVFPAYSSQLPSESSSVNVLVKNLGSVEESFFGTADKKIIYIQDAHDSLEAQRNIARMIRKFVEKENVETVYEEGYDGPVPSDQYFGFIKDAKLKEKVSYKLMDRLRIGGAEYAHINRKKDFRLIGADSVELLLREVAAYRKMSELRGSTSRDIEELSHQIEQLANRHFPRQLKEWIRLKHRLDQNKIELVEYLRRTLSLRDKKSWAAYPHLSLLLEPESKKNAEKLTSIDGKTFFLEMDSLENDLSRQYLTTEQDEKIFKFYKYLELVTRLLHMELKSSEYDALKEQLQSFDTRMMAEFIHAQTGRPLVLSKEWESNIREAVDFYEISRERDFAVEKKMDEFLTRSEEKTAVLVYGGFHKDRIKEILRRKNISYEIMMPVIAGPDEGHRALYKDMMSAGYKPLGAETLARAARYPPVYVDALSMPPERLLDLIRNLAGESSARSEVRTHEMDPGDKLVDVKRRLVSEAQGLLNFYATQTIPGQSPNLTERDSKNNIIILILGSPSVETYLNAAASIAKWKAWYGKKTDFKIMASTGVGRGTARLIFNTQKHYDGSNKAIAAQFTALRAARGDALTEAEVIEFILKNSGVTDEIILESVSVNTWANMVESKKIIKENVLPGLASKKSVKIQVTTDGFHRLRALLQALRIFDGEGWQIAAESLYVPDLASLPHEDFVNYLEFLLGYPKDLDSSKMAVSEGERIHNYGLGAQLDQREPSLTPFDFSQTPWPFERQKKMQELFREYISLSQSIIRVETAAASGARQELRAGYVYNGVEGAPAEEKADYRALLTAEAAAGDIWASFQLDDFDKFHHSDTSLNLYTAFNDMFEFLMMNMNPSSKDFLEAADIWHGAIASGMIYPDDDGAYSMKKGLYSVSEHGYVREGVQEGTRFYQWLFSGEAAEMRKDRPFKFYANVFDTVRSRKFYQDANTRVAAVILAYFSILDGRGYLPLTKDNLIELNTIAKKEGTGGLEAYFARTYSEGKWVQTNLTQIWSSALLKDLYQKHKDENFTLAQIEAYKKIPFGLKPAVEKLEQAGLIEKNGDGYRLRYSNITPIQLDAIMNTRMNIRGESIAVFRSELTFTEPEWSQIRERVGELVQENHAWDMVREMDDKEKARDLEAYNQGFREPWGALGDKTISHNINYHLAELVSKKKVVVWTDAGSGNGIALRQGKVLYGKKIRTHGLDLLDLDKLSGPDYWLEKDIQRRVGLNVFSEENAPDSFQTADVGTAQIPADTDLLTAAYVLQYSKDPLAAIVNLYNQLKTGATLAIKVSSNYASQFPVARDSYLYRIGEFLHASGDRVKVGYRGWSLIHESGRFNFENYRSADEMRNSYPLTLFVTKAKDTVIQTNLAATEGDKVLDGVIVTYALKDGFQDAFVMNPAPKSEVRTDLQAVANHPGWKILNGVYPRIWLGKAHITTRLLKSYPQVLEDAAGKMGKASFLEFLDSLVGQDDSTVYGQINLFQTRLNIPQWMWHEEPDYAPVIDVDDLRYSEFFRYPQQYAWFYKNILERLQRLKAEPGAKQPLRIDLVGPAYFQEPVTLLALIKTAYQKAGVTIGEVPLEFNIFDRQPEVFDLLKKDGVVYDKTVIERQMAWFLNKLQYSKGDFKNTLINDFTDIQNTFYGLLTPLTSDGSLSQIYLLPAEPSDPWLKSMRFSSAYESTGEENKSDYAFMNYVLLHVEGWRRYSLLSTIAKRAVNGGVVFASPDPIPGSEFTRHSDTALEGLESESISVVKKSEVRTLKDEMLQVRKEALEEKASVTGQAADYAQVTIDEIDRVLEVLDRVPEDALDAETKRWVATFLPTEEGDKLLRMQDLAVFQKIMRGAPDEDLSPFPIRAWHMLRVQRFFRALTAGNFDYYLKRLPSSASEEVRSKYRENLQTLKRIYDELSQEDKIKIWLEIKFHDTGYAEEKGTGVGHEPRGAVIAKKFIEEELGITGSIPEDVADIVNRHMGIGYAYLGEKRIGTVLGSLSELKVRFLLLHVSSDAPAAINTGMSFAPDQLEKTVSWLDPAKRLDTIDHNDQYRLEQLARLHVMAPKLTPEQVIQLNETVSRIFGADEAKLRGLLRSEADITDGVALMFWQLSANDPTYSRYVKFMKLLLYVSEILGGRDTEIRSEITKSYPVPRVEAVKIITAKLERLLDAVPENVSLEDVQRRLGDFKDGEISDLFGVPIKRVGKEAILIVSQFYEQETAGAAAKSEVRVQVDAAKIQSVIEEAARLAAERGIAFGENTQISLLIARQKGRSAGDKKYDYLFRELYPSVTGEQPQDAARISYAVQTEEELEELLEIIRVSPRFVGAVITAPWKTAAAKYTDSLTPLAESLRSVNNITKTSDGKLIGDAVDGRSFVQAYGNEAGGFAGKQIMLLGLGGAGRQIAEELAPLSPAAINFAVKSSNVAEAEIFARSLRSRFPKLVVTVTELGSFRFSEVLAENNVLVNATGQEMPLETSQTLPAGLFAVELSNLSPITPFLVHAKQNGAKIANGTEMALYNSLIHASRWIQQMTGKTFEPELLAEPLRRYNHEVLGLPTAEEAYGARSEVRLAQAPAQTARYDIRALMEQSADIPAALFFPYQEIVKPDSKLREGVLALSVLTKGSKLKLVIYGADPQDLSLRELSSQGVKISPLDFKGAYALHGEKENGRNVNVSTDADELRRQLGEVPGVSMNHVLAEQQSDVWAAYLRAIIDPSQPIQGMDNSQGYYRVTGDFLRSQLQKYHASLVILASA